MLITAERDGYFGGVNVGNLRFRQMVAFRLKIAGPDLSADSTKRKLIVAGFLQPACFAVKNRKMALQTAETTLCCGTAEESKAVFSSCWLSK